MPKSLLLIIFSALAFSVSVHAQEFSYTQYNTKDGLAGSTVYCAVQDKDGFMWFGTETGLSRFDGTNFKNFTTANGLSNNEILEIFCDSKGRVWLSPFKKEICYYYKGKIYNSTNDSILARLKMEDWARQICEDDHGNILIMEAAKLHKITASGKVIEINNTGTNNSPLFAAISKSANGNFLVCDGNIIYELNAGNQFKFIYQGGFANHLANDNSLKLTSTQVVWMSGPAGKKPGNIIHVYSIINKSETLLEADGVHVSFDIINDSLICENTSSGSALISNPASVANRLINARNISSVYLDNEKNFWCTSLGAGVYRVNSIDFKNILLYDNNKESIGAYAILRSKNNIFIGADQNNFGRYNLLNHKLDIAADLFGPKTITRVLAIENLDKNNFIVAHDGGLFVIQNDPVRNTGTGLSISVKGVFKINKDSLLVANNHALLLIGLPDLKIKDTLWNGRTTTVFFKNDTVYAGSFDGLIIIDKHKHAIFPGTHFPQLASNITGITASSDGIIWISTYGAGVVGWYNGSVIANITEANGLTSNICRCIYADGNTIWLGTEKGLNKIDISRKPFNITKITSSDALISDIINAVYVDEGIVYAATPDGVTYFNQKNISLSSRCDLKITQIITAEDTFTTDVKSLQLIHGKNAVSFEYAGISFKSAGDITYYYKLTGLDEQWQKTTRNFINYTILPPGSYVFKLKAINKFGVESNTISIPLEIEPRIWETAWFKIILALLVITAVWFIVQARIKYIHRKNNERMQAVQRMAQLEQMALRSQMNPHFIFNSLNSIQQYVMDKDVTGANRFISGFSKLIRKTLEFSSKEYISLSEELQYITTYLELEEERSSHKFSYTIECVTAIHQNHILVPAMILQPYIENSIRHGISYRSDHNGKITVLATQQDDMLIIVIEDNGIGRKETEKYKTANTIQYQSKGMSLTASRVEMMNRNNPKKINVIVEDVEVSGLVKGTRVTIHFPVINTYSEK